SFDSGSTNSMVSVAQQKRVPLLVDIAAADPITANVAKSVKEGQQKVQYVYRNFPTGSSFGRNAVQYFTEIFKEASVSPKRVELMGIVGPGSPGLYEAGQFAVLKEDLEYVMTSVPWPSFKNPRTLAVAEEYAKRTERETGRRRTFDTNSGYSYDALFLIADILERAATLGDPDAIVEAMRKTR